MKRFTLVALLLLFTPCLFSQDVPQNTAVEFSWSPPARHHLAACRIIAGNSIGSGTYVNMGGPCLVVTCRHVVGGARRAKVIFRNGSHGVGDVYTDNDGNDLAIVVIQDAKTKPIPLAAHPPQPGEWVELTGFAHSGYRNSTGDGNYILRHWYGRVKQSGNSRAQYDAGVAAGDSGGGILNMRGEFVGVVTDGTTSSDYDNDYRHRTHAQSAGPSLNVIHTMAKRCCERFRNGNLFPPQQQSPL